jgi:N utilization substance protein A
MEVPEIYDHIIEIKAIAREPGSKAKIAVFAADVSVDPVGSCVGVRGNRVRAITNELNGEKIDVILWDKNIAQFVINSMTPAQISKIVFDEDKRKVEIVVPDDQLSLAIGRRGQNVRLASKITGWAIDVMTEEQEEIAAISKKSQVIRVEAKEIPSLGRQTQGVRIMKLREGDFLASITCL